MQQGFALNVRSGPRGSILANNDSNRTLRRFSVCWGRFWGPWGGKGGLGQCWMERGQWAMAGSVQRVSKQRLSVLEHLGHTFKKPCSADCRETPCLIAACPGAPQRGNSSNCSKKQEVAHSTESGPHKLGVLTLSVSSISSPSHPPRLGTNAMDLLCKVFSSFPVWCELFQNVLPLTFVWRCQLSGRVPS